MSDTVAYRDLTGMSVLLKSSLGIFMAVAAIGLWFGWLEIGLWQRMADGGGAAVTEAEAAASDARQTFAGRLYLLVFLVTGIIFLRWIYSSCRNARALGASDMRFTPGWAVGWYLVPVACLWKPYQAMQETFRASHPDFVENWQEAPAPAVLPVWWTLWIASNVTNYVSMRLTLQAATLDELLAASRLTEVLGLLDLPLALVAIVMVGKLTTWQSAKHQHA